MVVEVYKRGCLFNDRFVDYARVAEILQKNGVTAVIEGGLLDFSFFCWVAPKEGIGSIDQEMKFTRAMEFA